MAFFLTIIATLAIVLVAVLSLFLSFLDREKMRAFIIAKSQKNHLDVIVRFVDERVSAYCTDPDSAARLRSLAGRYFELKKNKYALERIPLVNSIVSLYQSIELGGSLSGGGDARDDLGDAVDDIRLLRAEYNFCVIKLNKRLDNRLLARTGSLFRINKLEELCEFPSFLFHDDPE